MSQIHAVILAAGHGKRMKSALPKALHTLAGRAMLDYVVDAARKAGAGTVHVVHGHQGEQLRGAFSGQNISWVTQTEQLGTGHAASQAMSKIPDDDHVLVLYGDVPLVNSMTLARALESAVAGDVGLITVALDDPTGYGRIVRDTHGWVSGIVEHIDASEAERSIREVNTGIIAAPAARLRRWLAGLENDNSQGEYYLTDIIALAVADDCRVHTTQPDAVEEVMGVNDRVQLARLERWFQRREAERLMREGVSIADPARFDVRGEVRVGHDIEIDVNAVLEGEVELADGVRIGPNVCIKNAVLGAGTTVLANSVIEDAQIGADCRIGPFARIRPGAHLNDNVHVGNFVEIKNTSVGLRSKVNHLSYVGDSDVGQDVNVGAGTITCNYDGANKHRTIIEDGAFIGSGVELVAPVTVHAGATIGAGSTVSKDAPAGELTVARVRQSTVAGWKRPKKR